MLGALFYKLFEGCWSKGKFDAIQDDVKNAQFPDLKLDTLPVPLEARIALWLEREAHSQFSVRRLEISKCYHLRTLSRPCKVLKQLFLNGLERSLIQVDLKNAQFPDIKLETFPVPLEARIAL